MKRATLAALIAVAGCNSSAALPPISYPVQPGGPVAVVPATYDAIEGGPCRLSADGVLWYRVRAPAFPPMSVGLADCSAPSVLRVNANPALPSWSRPSGPTQAIFVPASSAQSYLAGSLPAIHGLAAGFGFPLTWLVSDQRYFAADAALLSGYHSANGDDLETSVGLTAPAQSLFPWYGPSVAVAGASRERDISGAIAAGDHAFWGITWNSHGVDGTSDEGAPWGTYCADPASYKRPDPSGNCSLVSFEWTARDLTRAYFSGREDAYSTDPEDVLMRAGFSPAGGAAYERALIDAYAAAGESSPLVVVSHEEAEEYAMYRGADAGIMSAIYDEASRTGMRVSTMRAALAPAAAFSARPRAVAFPFIPGVTTFLPAPILPATIDYHDSAAGMTFESGRALPLRIFEYADAIRSFFNVPLPQVQPGDMPVLTTAGASGGRLFFHFVSVRALHAGIAIWGDPQALGLTGNNIVAAGRAGAVAVFDLPQGASDQSVACAACVTTAVDYPL